MDLRTFKEEQVKKMFDEKRKFLEKSFAQKNNLNFLKGYIEKLVPVKNEIIPILEKLNGRDVEITLYNQVSNKHTIYKNQKLHIENNNITIDDYILYPLIGIEGVYKIKDLASSKVIYQNKLWMEEIAIQKAFLVGKEEAEKEIQRREEEIKAFDEIIESNFEDKSYAIQNIDKWISQGASYLYPQYKDEWKEYVCSRVASEFNVYNGRDVEITIKILDMLDRKEPNEAISKIIKNIEYEEIKYSIGKAVFEFSKDGVEFYSQNKELFKDHDLRGSLDLKKEFIENINEIK